MKAPVSTKLEARRNSGFLVVSLPRRAAGCVVRYCKPQNVKSHVRTRRRVTSVVLAVPPRGRQHSLRTPNASIRVSYSTETVIGCSMANDRSPLACESSCSDECRKRSGQHRQSLHCHHYLYYTHRLQRECAVDLCRRCRVPLTQVTLSRSREGPEVYRP